MGDSETDGTGGPGETTTTTTGTTTSTDSSSSNDAPFEHEGTLDASFATNGEFPTDENPADGRPPDFAEVPPEPDVDPSTFETIQVNGETVRLAPAEVVVDWYRRGEVRVADARGMRSYRRRHVYGAVLSPAQGDSAGGGIPDWPTGDRVVTYCGCPHHLSSIRAAGLQKAGYTDVFAIDEGFIGRDDSWNAKRYPMSGTEFEGTTQASVSEWTITGTVDPTYAGEYVWATAVGESEAAPIAPDGSYELHLRAAGADEDTTVEMRTPAGTSHQSLGDVATATPSTA